VLTSLALTTLLVAYPAPRDPVPTDKGPGYLGITFEAAEEGVRVTDVRSDGPAITSGIRADDIIVKFNGEPLQFDIFAKKIMRLRPGTLIPLEIKRGEERLVVKVRLGVRPDDFPYPIPVDPEPELPNMDLQPQP